MAIKLALLKYGYSNFSLDILEFCEISNPRVREIYYFDLLYPKDNIFKPTGSSYIAYLSPENLMQIPRSEDCKIYTSN